MTIEVFWGSGSPFSWRVLLTLEVKGVAYTSRQIEFSKGQHKAPDYLALNPRGKLPTLRDGDYVLPESLAIMAYLDRRFPEPPLFGRSAEETGRVWKAVADCEHYFDPAASRITRPLIFGGVAEKAEDMREAAAEVHAELVAMEKAVAARDWLAGDALSAADIAVYPFVELLLRVAGREAARPLDLRLLPFGARYPALEAWRKRIGGLPGYARTYPPHWREAA